MKHLLTVLLFSIYSLTIMSQEINDSIFTENQKIRIDSIFSQQLESQEKFKLELNEELVKNQEIQNKKIDSLNHVLSLHNANENYFNTILSSQTTIFSVIVAILTTFIGFISFRTFKKEVNNVKNQYEKSIENYEKMDKSMRVSDSYLYSSLGLLHTKEKLHGASIIFYIKGIINDCYTISNKEMTIKNIKVIVRILTNEFSKKDNDDIIQRESDLFKYLNNISHITDNDILNEIAILRTTLLKKIEEAKAITTTT